jgi:meiotically up-regulated gene 157 (Mug157) protein
MFTVVVLDYMLQMNNHLWLDSRLMKRMKKLRSEIQDGIEKYGIVYHEKYGNIYAYEVDGLGNYFLMDDANVPSLLSIPYLGYDYNEEIYDNTKRFIFSTDNPSYHKGWNKWTGEIEGIGSSHAHKKWEVIPEDVWPMSIIMKGLVSNDANEKVNLVHQLLEASASTGWMHESFNVNNPFNFSRSWFCWPDSLFAELVMSLTDECPRPHRGQYTIKEWLDSELPGSAFARD